VMKLTLRRGWSPVHGTTDACLHCREFWPHSPSSPSYPKDRKGL
jgi:hypothetical protein